MTHFLVLGVCKVLQMKHLKLSRVANATPETVFRSFSAGLDVCKVGKIHAGVKNLTPATVMFRCLQGGENSPPEL